MIRYLLVYALLFSLIILTFETGRFIGFTESVAIFEAFLHD